MLRQLFLLRLLLGSAYWAGETELEKAGALNAKRGLPLGRLIEGGSRVGLRAAINAVLDKRLPAKKACQEFYAGLRRRRSAPLVTMPPHVVNSICFGAVGSGKSTALVIPWLLTNNESAVVLDYSGELALATYRARRKMGHDVQVLDPYEAITPKLRIKTATFNPLDFISKESPHALDECNDIAEALVIRGEEKEPHWPDKAEQFISAVSAVTVQYGSKERRSLQDVSDIIAKPEKLDIAIKLGLQSQAWGGLLARNVSELLHAVDKEKSGILSTTSRFLRFLNTPAMVASTLRSSFDPATLKRGKQTVFIVLPAIHMKAQAGWLRLMVGSMIRAVIRHPPDESRKVHFILDESAALGGDDFSPLEALVDRYRKWGARAQFYYQSRGQLNRVWKKDAGATLMSNAAPIFLGGARDIDTATLISSMLGKETIIVEGWDEGQNRGGSTSHSHDHMGGGTHGGSSEQGRSNSTKFEQIGRELLTADELLRLDPRIAISFPGGGLAAVATRTIRYFEAPWLFTGKHGGIVSRFRAAVRTLIGSAVVLATVIVLAVMLTHLASEQSKAASNSLSYPTTLLPNYQDF